MSKRYYDLNMMLNRIGQCVISNSLQIQTKNSTLKISNSTLTISKKETISQFEFLLFGFDYLR